MSKSIRSKIFIPSRFNNIISNVNASCQERGFYKINKCNLAELIWKYREAIGFSVERSIEKSVLKTNASDRYVGLNRVADSNEGVIISALIPKDMILYARHLIDLYRKGKPGTYVRSIRAWQIMLQIFLDALEYLQTDDEIENTLLNICAIETKDHSSIKTHHDDNFHATNTVWTND